MIISEIFGPTIQGEGASAGLPCGFVRLGRCNLTCSWCDTPYTWDWSGQSGKAYKPVEELTDIPIVDIVDRIAQMAVPMVVITGGEPLLHRSELASLCHEFKKLGLRVEIETNGTLPIWPELRQSVDQVNVGLKLANSDISEARRIVAGAIRSFIAPTADTLSSDGYLADQPAAVRSENALIVTFKFVLRQVSELDEVADVQQKFQLPDAAIWVMPEGTVASDLVAGRAALEAAVASRGWRLSNRLHILKWGDRRGV